MNKWIKIIDDEIERIKHSSLEKVRESDLLIVYALLAIADELRRGRQNDREP